MPVQVYADYCYDRLAKMITRGAKHGQKKPTDDDIAHAMVRLFYCLFSLLYSIVEKISPYFKDCMTVLPIVLKITEGRYFVTGNSVSLCYCHYSMIICEAYQSRVPWSTWLLIKMSLSKIG